MPRPAFLLPALVLAPFALGAQEASVKEAFDQGKNLWASAGDREGALAKFESVATALQAKGKAMTAPERPYDLLPTQHHWPSWAES